MVLKGSLLKFCFVVEGSVDIYLCFGLICEWDIGVGYVIVEIVGVMVSKFDGSLLLYNSKEEYLNLYFVVLVL